MQEKSFVSSVSSDGVHRLVVANNDQGGKKRHIGCSRLWTTIFGFIGFSSFLLNKARRGKPIDAQDRFLA
jgi:hypothetical protein